MPLIDYKFFAKIYASILAPEHVIEESASAKTFKAAKDLFSRDDKIVSRWCAEHTKENIFKELIYETNNYTGKIRFVDNPLNENFELSKVLVAKARVNQTVVLLQDQTWQESALK